MRKTIILTAILVAFSTIAAKAQQIVNVSQKNNDIVVEYDLTNPADFVRLYVSLDGGESFESDQVRFKLSVKLKEKWYKETFITFNGAYSFLPQASFGFSVGQVKHFGWFVSVMSNGNFSGFSHAVDCDGNGYTSEGYLPSYTGEKSKMRLSVMGGGVMRLSGPLCARVGVGYGNRTMRWQVNDGSWNRIKDSSFEGVDLSAGLQLNLGGFVASLEAVTTQFQTIEGKLGLGFSF